MDEDLKNLNYLQLSPKITPPIQLFQSLTCEEEKSANHWHLPLTHSRLE